MQHTGKFVFNGKTIDFPNDLREVSRDQLSELARELRLFVGMIPVDKPAHRTASLGVVEITVALHYWLNTPEDHLVFDVGHQAYAHKVITGRADQMNRLRQIDGPSGFLLPAESVYDMFVTGHSSTSLSAMAGVAYADRLSGVSSRRYVAVIGDGAMTAGVAMEALNFIGEQQLPVIIVLNDNSHSIDATRGALHANQTYRELASTFGLQYQGALDGHSVEDVLQVLEQLPGDKPVLLHCKTQTPVIKEIPQLSPHSFAFSIEQKLRAKMERDERIVLVSPAMLSGAGWRALERDFPDRVVDVGITEQHAVAFCAGLVKAGKVPVCHIYSTFFQRAVDQFIHDIAIAQLPVLFLIDRAGLVGEDGPTHHGVFDWPVLLSVPGVQVYAPATPERAGIFVDELLGQITGPTVIRYPRDGSIEPLYFEQRGGNSRALVYFGALGEWVREVLAHLSGEWDVVCVERPGEDWPQLHAYQRLVFFQDCPESGGPAEYMLRRLHHHSSRYPEHSVIALPDAFVPHGNMDALFERLGFDAEKVAESIERTI